MNKNFSKILKDASKTFYFSSLLFPKEIKKDLVTLYAFLRITDNLVDAKTPDIEKYEDYKKLTLATIGGVKTMDPLLESFSELIKRKNIPIEWVNDYFKSQDLDLKNRRYETFQHLQLFMYGVSEVVGLFMAAIMDLTDSSYESARKLGLGMQLINIIRDVKEDYERDKIYLPLEEIKEYGLDPDTLLTSREEKFSELIKYQIARAIGYIEDGQKGYSHIPPAALPAVAASSDLYLRLAKKIINNPLVITREKIRISTAEIIYVVVSKML